MAFIDELKIHISAGKGGNVYIRAIRDIAVLSRYKNTKEFVAEKGEDGMKKSMNGKNGQDLFIDVPIGSIVTNLETREVFNLVEDGKEIKVLNGGKGGLGNEY